MQTFKSIIIQVLHMANVPCNTTYDYSNRSHNPFNALHMMPKEKETRPINSISTLHVETIQYSMLQCSTNNVYIALFRRSYGVQQLSRQFKASSIHHQCMPILLNLSRLMTHHHVNITRNFNTTRNDSTRQVMITVHDSSQLTVQDIRAIIQAYCSG